MKEKRKTTLIDDKSSLRAFIVPEMFSFLLEIYIKDGKTEESLNDDIKLARTKYKEIVSLSKPKQAQNLVKA